MSGRMTRRRVAFGLAALALAAGCGAPEMNFAETGDPEAKIAELTRALLALGTGVDAGEAARVARIAVLRPLDWAEDWQVVDPPLRHNIKVIHGLREKGVCRDWTNALHAALRAEGLRTIDLHVGYANARNVKLEHVSVVVSAAGRPMEEGLLLDPWRVGQGRLWFAKVTEDPRYRWETLEAVRAWQATQAARPRG
ncbi:hypothetical protein [Marinovum sp.]|uniref:hypothetical protein n=1 Tax=Marinovum sp. TaxID=2024839 RepID=UPI002B26A3DF|nr:hypothetical protein [Marinovum sp.]